MIKSVLIFLGLIALSTSLHLHLQGKVKSLVDWDFDEELPNLQTGKKLIYFSSTSSANDMFLLHNMILRKILT